MRYAIATAILLTAIVQTGADVSDASVRACVKNANGQTRIVAAGESCGPAEHVVTWSVQGAAGAPGSAGADGQPGPAGPQGPAGPGAPVVFDAYNQEIGTLSGPSLMFLTIGGVRFQAAVGPAGFTPGSLQVFYAALDCAGPPYSTATMSSELFFRQLAPVGSTGYFVSGTPIAPPPSVLPPGLTVLQGYSFKSRIGAGFGPCTNGTSVFGPTVLFYPLSTVDLSGFVAPFHIQ